MAYLLPSQTPKSTDYGRPIKHFFIEIPISLGLGRQFGHIDFEAFGVFSFHLLAPILVPLSMFSINQLLFLQKNLYIQIPNIHLGFGCDFGPQRIRNLAIVCPQFVPKSTSDGRRVCSRTAYLEKYAKLEWSVSVSKEEVKKQHLMIVAHLELGQSKAIHSKNS